MWFNLPLMEILNIKYNNLLAELNYCNIYA